MSFVFFDTETTGLSSHFDQIVHFAAIKTDASLNELERFEIRSRLCGHVVPNPSALWVNGIGISQLLDPALPSHYEMMRKIYAKLLSWSPSIFAGFNSIRFDEEMLRQAFFQTLHPVYLTSKFNNGRGDVLNLAMSAVATAAGSLTVPLGENGRRSFKLPGLLAANNIAHGRAHDAMSDVAATVDLCRLIRSGAPQAWQSFNRFAKKATTIDFVESGEPFVLTQYYSGEAYHTPVVCIGPDPMDPSKRLCLALNSRTRALLVAPASTVLEALSQKGSPVRRVKINAGPSLTALYDADDLEFDLSEAELESLAEEVKANTAACQSLVGLIKSQAKPWPAGTHVEQQLYEGFISPEDEALFQRFHDGGWPERLAVLGQLKDARLRTLGLRLIHSEAPHVLNPSQRMAAETHLSQRLQDEKGPMRLDRAIVETDALLTTHAGEDTSRLSEYRRYLLNQLAAAA